MGLEGEIVGRLAHFVIYNSFFSVLIIMWLASLGSVEGVFILSKLF